MFNSANNRALSTSRRGRAATAKRAAPPSMNPGASELRNTATSVWSWVRMELLTAPKALISLKSAVYVAPSSAGGGPGRNCSGAVIVQGVTYRHCGKTAGAKAGGVGTQTPGPLPGVYGTVAAEPSLARRARMTAATALPSAMPSVLAAPSDTADRDAARAVSSAAVCDG